MTRQERDELLIRIDERQKSILAEVKKTNGRVTVLEMERMPYVEKWMSSVKASTRTLIFVFSAIGVVLGIIATLIAS